MMRKPVFFFFLLFGAALLPLACAYNTTSVQGIQVTQADIQQIKVGRTTGLDLVLLLGPPTRLEKLSGYDRRLVYSWTEIRSLTYWGGYRAVGLYDKEVRQNFEVVLKQGEVQSYGFIKP